MDEKIVDLERLCSQKKYARKRLEYIFPRLIIEEMATPQFSSTEQLDLDGQIREWKYRFWNDRGLIGNCIQGYAFGGLSSRNFQLIPNASYIDENTKLSLSLDDRRKTYIPCVPTVVIEIASETDNISKLKKKISLFMQHGTREGLIVDTRRNYMWIFNDKEKPVCYPLGTVIFDFWPGFELDCKSIRKFRMKFEE
jgi:Uma2 family endonuclease